MGPDDKICYCYNVPYRKLWSFAIRRKLHRASQLSECLGAGTGCGWCIPVLQRIFENSQAPVPKNAPPDSTPAEYALSRQKYIQDKKPRHEFSE